MTVLLELDQMSKTYGALRAVDDFALAVQEGEALAIIGPNGQLTIPRERFSPMTRNGHR